MKADVQCPARFGDWNNWWRAGGRKIKRGENKRFAMKSSRNCAFDSINPSDDIEVTGRVKQPVEMTGGEETGLAEIWRLINVVRF
jgi:hypothetical protein